MHGRRAVAISCGIGMSERDPFAPGSVVSVCGDGRSGRAVTRR